MGSLTTPDNNGSSTKKKKVKVKSTPVRPREDFQRHRQNQCQNQRYKVALDFDQVAFDQVAKEVEMAAQKSGDSQQNSHVTEIEKSSDSVTENDDKQMEANSSQLSVKTEENPRSQSTVDAIDIAKTDAADDVSEKTPASDDPKNHVGSEEIATRNETSKFDNLKVVISRSDQEQASDLYQKSLKVDYPPADIADPVQLGGPEPVNVKQEPPCEESPTDPKEDEKTMKGSTSGIGSKAKSNVEKLAEKNGTYKLDLTESEVKFMLEDSE